VFAIATVVYGFLVSVAMLLLAGLYAVGSLTLAFTVALSAYLWRSRHVSVAIHDDRLLVKNTLRTFSLARSDIATFTIYRPPTVAERLFKGARARVVATRSDGSETNLDVTESNRYIPGSDSLLHQHFDTLQRWLMSNESNQPGR
jgi:hypothetical protein